jgi:DNA end-binding protein Ku
VDPIYMESSYYMAPDEGGQKPYALLFEALRETNYYGVAKIAMHNREHIVILRPTKKGMLLHTMYFQDEIRQVEEFSTDTSQVKEKEVNLAKMLIESLAADFEPQKYHDTFRVNIQKLIEAKLEGQKVVATPTPHIAPVIDIMEALKRSLAEQKKPVRSATAVAGEAEEEAPEQPVAKKRRRSGGS